MERAKGRRGWLRYVWIPCLLLLVCYGKRFGKQAGAEELKQACMALIQRKAEITMSPLLRMGEREGGHWGEEEMIDFLVPVLSLSREEPMEIVFPEGSGQEFSEGQTFENRAKETGDGGEGAERTEGKEGTEPADIFPQGGESIMEKSERAKFDPGKELDPGEEIWEDAALARQMENTHAILPASMATFEDLVKNYYVIDSTTMADETLLKPREFLEKDLRIDKNVNGPQILIYHTHSQEAFIDSRAGEASDTVVGVGEELARILREEYGYDVLHHVETYDLPSRNGAYSKALPKVEKLLKEYPSIQVVIDLHRDEMPENVRLVTEIDGKKTARFMFFNGISRTKKTGELEYLHNEYLEDNLAFSLQMELAAREVSPDLTRKIYLKGYRYNMHVCPKTLLIELGAQNNTLEEAINACGPLAEILDQVLSGKSREKHT